MTASVECVYHEYIWNNNMVKLAEYFYDTPAISLGDISSKARMIVDSYKKTGWHTPEQMKSLNRCEAGPIRVWLCRREN